MTVGYLTAVVMPLMLDSRQFSHVLYDKPRSYPHGPATLFLAPIVGLATFVAIRCRVRPVKLFGPLFALLTCLGIALPAFTPPMPHGNLVFWGFMYSVASFVGCWCHLTPDGIVGFETSDASADPYTERVRSSIEFWRSLTLLMAGGYLAIILTWLKFLYDVSDHILTDPGERLELSFAAGWGAALFSLFVVFGPVREALNRWRQAVLLLTHAPSK